MVIEPDANKKASPDYTIQMQLCAKPEVVPSIPEDLIGYGHNRVFLADGAGGIGVFALEWAEILSAYLPEKPIKTLNSLNQLIDSVWEGFFDHYKVEAESLGISGKFLEEGSYCTYIALWETDLKRWEGFVYGDSVLLVFDMFGNIKVCSMADINSFNNNPNLLSWKEQPVEEAFQPYEIDLDPGDTIWLMSDALAQHVLIAYHVINTTTQASLMNKSGTKLANISESMKACYTDSTEFKRDIIEPLAKAIQTNETFEAYMRELYKAGLLTYYDYSIISIHKHV